MRIHLPLHPEHFGTQTPTMASGPLAQLGGELVVIELQGELKYEGDKDGGVVGVLGLDRPDRPTLHVGAHHLLHGKIASLPRPYAVIRRVAAGTSSALDGDAEEEESDAAEEEEDAGSVGGPSRAAAAAATPSKAPPRRVPAAAADEEEEDDGPLFPEAEAMATPARARQPPSSSPWAPPSSARDYSSDLSSPAGPLGWPSSDFDHDDEDNDDDDEVERKRRRARDEERAERERELRRRERRRAARPERTRHYEVVGVVRKKVVFALRPEPLVQPTPLPE